MTTASALLSAGLVLITAHRLRPRPSRIGDEAVDHRPHVRRSIGARGSRREARATAAPRPVAEWCDHLARRLRSGTSLRDALLTTIPDDDPVRRLTDPMRQRLDRGESVAAAVETVESPGTHLHLALTIIGTAARVGGSAAPAIDRTAASLRGRAADHDEREAQAAQARMSAHVLTAVPLLMLALLVMTDSDARDAVTSRIGMFCLGVGLSLNLAGSAWMRQMIRAKG